MLTVAVLVCGLMFGSCIAWEKHVSRAATYERRVRAYKKIAETHEVREGWFLARAGELRDRAARHRINLDNMIAPLEKRAEYHARLREKYEAGAAAPSRPVVPDPPEPK
jgi:hypothetical protein